MLKIKILCHYENMSVPKKHYLEDAGLDLTIMAIEKKRDNVYFFDTGISIEPPKGYYGELFCRSSIYTTDFIMINSVGIIDYNYRGKIYMPMRYIGQDDGDKTALSMIGKRLGQFILKKMYPFQIDVVQQLSETIRGTEGFGSSGF